MRKIALFVALIFITVACTNYDDIRVEDVRYGGLSAQSTSKIILTLDVKINNPTKKKLTITDGTLELFQQDRNLATLSVSNPMVIAPKSNEYNQLVLNVTVKDFMALLGIKLNSNDFLEQFDVEGFLKVKAGAAGKKLNIPRTNFNNLLQSL